MQTITNAHEYVGKNEPSYSAADVNVSYYNHYGKQFEGSLKN
jgi:hypothetical protein